MKHKLLFLKSVMTVLLALFSLGVFAYDAEVDGLSYNLDRTNVTAAVTRNASAYPEGDVNIPESFTYNDTVWTVTSIEDNAFQASYKLRNLLTSVTIPSTVTSIGRSAFYGCQSLTSVAIPSSVLSIGDNAFDGCTSLTIITVDSDNANYSSKDGVVYDKAGTMIVIYPQGKTNSSFYIPNGVTTIGGYTFKKCTHLNEIIIPASVTTIEQNAFYGTNISWIVCHADLQNLTWADTESFASSSPKPTCYVEGEAWVWEEKFPDVNVRFRGSGPSVGDMFYVDRMRYVVTSEKDKTVELMSFSDNGSYVALDIPAVVNDSFDDYVGQDFTVTSIGQRAFSRCTGLTSVTIPASVTSIGSEAFSECSNLTSVTFAEGSQLTSIGSGAFESCPLASITIPASVTSMEGAFSSCRKLTSINVDPNNAIYSSKDGVVFDKPGTTLLLYPEGKSDISYIIPDGVTSIGRGAFSGSICQSVTIPTSVTDINKWAFYDCGIISVTLPDGVMSIGEEAFAWCRNLVSVTIPASVTSVGQYAFAASTNVADVYCYAAPDALQYFFFSEGTGVNWRSFKPEKGTKLHVADASAWEMFANDNVTIVGDLNDFFVEDNLRYKKIHQTETRASIRKAEGQNVVEVVGCVTSPTGAVDIPASVKHDGVDYAVTSIGESAFTNCSGMTSVTIPSSVTNIEDGAFDGCTGLTDVYCNADPAQLTWSADAQSFMADKATKFHVEDASAWSAFSDANVTFVDDKTPDAIESIAATDTADGAWYTLSGMKLEGEPTESGIYVKDGRKVMVK